VNITNERPCRPKPAACPSRRRALATLLAGVALLVLIASTLTPADAQFGPQDQVTFAVIGDYGTGGANPLAVANLVQSWNPAFVITLGDNNYPSGAASTIDQNVGQYYHSFIGNYMGGYGSGSAVNRFFPSPGNHDWLTAGLAPYLGYFTLPGNERYYSVRQGPVELFAIDSDPNEPDGVSPASIQGQWLHDGLAASTACWKLVYFHHAPYSSGPHGQSEWMHWPFQAWGADAVLAGHDHTYERLKIDGLTYFVNGLGGNAAYSFGSPVIGSIVRYNAMHGAMRITASQTAITYEFVNVAGTIIDTHTETGSCSNPTPTGVPTSTPSACLPRPRVQVGSVSDGPNRRKVTVTGAPGMPISSIRFGPTRNAHLDAPGGPPDSSGDFTVTLSPPIPLYTFIVRRDAAGQAVYVPFVPVDVCGDWKTFIGSGPNAF
jgi:tartrate-resistant acid phosphatase type 5